MARRAPEDRSPAELLAFGVVNLDKPPGPSAHQVAAWVRDAASDALADAQAAGRARDDLSVDGAAHAGTLDPKVTGCLPMLTGDATRVAQAFGEGHKEYVSVLELHADAPSDLEAVVAEFEGDIYQKPPRKSAVSRRLRTREILELDVLEVEQRRALLRIRCEPGTYIRKLCHDIGLAAGTGAHMGHLRRTATTPFDDATLVTLHDLVDAIHDWLDHEDDDPLREVLHPAERALEHLPRVTIAPSAAEAVADGAPIYAPGVIDAPDPDTVDSIVAAYTPNDAVVALGRLTGDADADSGEVVALERVLV
ncbi:RNA-guided pseudouridylation complex pseudouridine synthase subunit Cbf5 [Halorubellus sp. PRR65]|uniref:RNA-guided pseudouridylation complex pseudouridine synthase subunit Cbf5 n=1 Tax=Halorubellus sp. PRR65 TaxID=3098148 RepID=UPI002B25B20B|nr:RNA-guided pseudouridylation complex pseudouridine synthase subunit Cbf5 [Halorubellus sp. PRR65]